MYLPELYQEFLTYLQVERNYSPRTISAYRSDFRGFLDYLRQRDIQATVEAIDRQTVRGYIAGMRQDGLAPASVARHINSLRSFWNYLRDEDYAQVDPFARISLPKLPRHVPKTLSAEQAHQLLEAAEHQHCVFNAFRDKAILSLLVFAGLRRNEILQLQLGHIDTSAGTLQVIASKGGKSRVIPLPQQATEAVEDWLELRPQCDHQRLFTAKWGAPLSKNGLGSCLQRALDKAGIDAEGITLHTLRHTFATLMLKGGCNLYSLQQLLGHSRLDTTAQYLHAGLGDLREAISHHPLTHNA